MAKKTPTINYSKPPKTLKDHPFFGIDLSDQEQREFVDSIWDKDYDIVFCNARAGSGKTLLAVATSILMVQYGRYSEVIYMTAAGVHEWKQGLLPGDISCKSRALMEPVYQAVSRIGLLPENVIKTDGNLLNQKDGSAIITTMTNSYVRGINIGSADSPVVYLVDEAENLTRDELQTLLSRVNTGSKTIVIGHNLQCDLRRGIESGFTQFLEHFQTQDWCKVCTLSKNFRGRVSAWADEIGNTAVENQRVSSSEVDF